MHFNFTNKIMEEIMIDKETMLTQFCFYLFSISFICLGLLAFVGLIYPKLLTKLNLPNDRYKQFTILILTSLLCLAISHVFIPSGFP